MKQAETTCPVVGITGGVGSGKSTASDVFAELGWIVIDADRVGHDVLGAPGVAPALAERFGDSVLNAHGAVDRGTLGRIVFADERARRALESIVHPPMRARFEQQIAEARSSGAPGVVLDAAVLFEAGWDDMCTHTVFVDASDADRLARVASRGWGEGQWRRREAAQIPLDTKRQRCCYTLENRSDVSLLRDQVHAFVRRIRTGPSNPA